MSNTVNRGQFPNDQQADSLYEAFGKVNDKFLDHDDLKQVQDASEKQTPADNDKVGLIDSEAAQQQPKLKWLSWANVKATLKVYFDTVYSTLQLGETSSTAYRGDRGMTAYDHSQADHAPSNANNYTHPSGFTNQPGSALTGATVISRITVNTEGHVSGVSTRNLTASNIGAEAALNADQKRKITISTSNPSGGTDGDIWMQYE